ncbi:hypothetical protein [Methylobacterium haplocladii]|uniref:Uncharacterized protein n=1 Tax=Methylobacterium haplocladii TaxID=1176176 RepID=A0A512IRJ3_9HYPH|nr:hypothetical protein [Methylobacterium haplocladii]GEP00301.1 hypothetical protein MHA02_26880 [Methylobacterium haplocladii]GJD86072.1 hypothetical protein HPGCJGGD_3969 [Methylobacterium haplocladii]GLS59791.1 hypothetical protein GCM10007887_24640 [Methylobacterium haplocladii]
MALVHVVPLAEAAAFTIGCAVLNARRFDPERVGVVLMVLVVALCFALLVVGTATGDIAVAVPGPDDPYAVVE